MGEEDIMAYKWRATFSFDYPTCGNPSYIPAGSDVINDDGKIVHYAMLGADTGCSNPRCKKGQRRKDNRVTSEAENPL
jgi:hypothetical protein